MLEMAQLTSDRDETFCPNTVGGEHEPNVTLKDNDLNDANRLKLTRSDALSMTRQLRRDANLLRALGIMDYSLLLGVLSVEYPVDEPPPQLEAASAAPVADDEPHARAGSFSRISIRDDGDRTSLASLASHRVTDGVDRRTSKLVRVRLSVPRSPEVSLSSTREPC